jgi:osmoprotectant transport system substrate-binding protein
MRNYPSLDFILRHLCLFLLVVLVAISVISCGTPQPKMIRIGSKDFTEQFILAEMYAQLLEQAGLPIERKFNLGGTPVAHASLLSGEIDLYPEYTGTGLVTVLKQSAQANPQTVFAKVFQEYRQKFQLTWLQPAPMNNTQALVMTAAAAQKYQIKTISDLVAKARQLRMVGPPEFSVREDGLPGLKRVYGQFQLKEFLPIDAGLRYRALQAGQVDVAVGFGTDGEIAAFGLQVLKDDKNLFPPYQVAPVVRNQTLALYPQIKTILNALASHLTDQAMQELNFAVTGNQQEPPAVARQFLQQQGLLN